MASEEENIARFASAATRYCSTMENLDITSREALVIKLTEVLPDLYGAALQLPQKQRVTSDPISDTYGIAEHMKLFNALRKKLGDWDVYRCVFDPTQDTQAITCNLADDLADIYRDVREYFEGIAAGAALPDVMWEIRVGFETHWGEHLTKALAVVHVLRLRIP